MNKSINDLIAEDEIFRVRFLKFSWSLLSRTLIVIYFYISVVAIIATGYLIYIQDWMPVLATFAFGITSFHIRNALIRQLRDKK